jgi:hypothetical protein
VQDLQVLGGGDGAKAAHGVVRGKRSEWTRKALEADGFDGWVTFVELENRLPGITQDGGVYVVVQPPGASPAFLAANPGGRFKDRDPSVTPDALAANWVDCAEVVYIGKADNLRRRLREFMRFGSGAPIGHWGGRLIWQLAQSERLLVAWRETPEDVPREVEGAMIAAFREAFGKPPFANEPHRLGG